MKVYIILDEPDEFGFRIFVKKVFSDKEKAVDYVYGLCMKNRVFVGQSKQDLMKVIESIIHEAEVE